MVFQSCTLPTTLPTPHVCLSIHHCFQGQIQIPSHNTVLPQMAPQTQAQSSDLPQNPPPPQGQSTIPDQNPIQDSSQYIAQTQSQNQYPTQTQEQPPTQTNAEAIPRIQIQSQIYPQPNSAVSQYPSKQKVDAQETLVDNVSKNLSIALGNKAQTSSLSCKSNYQYIYSFMELL